MCVCVCVFLLVCVRCVIAYEGEIKQKNVHNKTLAWLVLMASGNEMEF